MVIPDGASSNNNDKESHERRSLAAAGIRRGDVQISKPVLEHIDWVRGVPDTSTHQHLASNAILPRVEEEGIERGQFRPRGIAVSTNDDSIQLLGDPPQLRRGSSSQNIREAALSQAHSMAVDPRSKSRDSGVVISPSEQDQIQTQKKRRSGTIRNVLRKVFGRREKTDFRQLTPAPPREPIASTPTGNKPVNRSHEEFYNTNPLRSQPANDHASPSIVAPVLPFPMNINAPDPSAGNYLSFETGPKVHRRRATLPSVILSADDVVTLKKMWSNPDLQTVSSSVQSKHARSPNIDMAYTSSMNLNRRSRSAGALRELSNVQEQTTALCRRSSDFKYREPTEIDLGQLDYDQRISSGSACRSEENSIAPFTHVSMTEVSDAFADTGSSVYQVNSDALSFGAIPTEHLSTTKEASLIEARLSRLEIDLQYLSLSLQEVTQQNARKSFFRDEVLSQQTSQTSLNGVRKDFGHTNMAEPSYLVSQATPTGHINPPHTSSLLIPTLRSPGPAQMSKPSPSQAASQAQSATPGEGIASPPPLYDRLAPLYTALEYERSVRKRLELQVLQLRQEVHEFGKIVSQLRGTEGYPTSSPDDTLGDEGHQTERSQYSGYDSDDDGKSRAEKWATPSEEAAPRPWSQTSPEREMF